MHGDRRLDYGHGTEQRCRRFHNRYAHSCPRWFDIAFFVKGLNPNGPYKSRPGKIGLSFSIGRYIVESGDLIVGASDNMAVVKRSEIDAVLADLQGTTEKEKALKAAIANGSTYMEIADEALESVEVNWVD